MAEDTQAVEFPELVSAAESRVDSDPALAEWRELLLDECWTSSPEYLRWLVNGPQAELLNWVSRNSPDYVEETMVELEAA